MERFSDMRMHFIGIGGIGMSGIAEVLHTFGYRVQGSDLKESPTTLRLKSLGIPVFIGHDASYLKGVDVVVVSTDIHPDNVEFQKARSEKIPLVHRADMLAELMRLKSAVAVAGTHGKTTTTSLVACLLEGAGLDPTVINGGVINAYGTNARRGTGEWVVAEADESDGSFMRLPATIGVVTNIDPEHMNFYGTEENLFKSFENFVSRLPFYGVGVLCIDHPVVRSLREKILDRRVVTYGLSEEADVQGIHLSLKEKGMEFDVLIRSHGHPSGKGLPQRVQGTFGKDSFLAGQEVRLEKIFLPMVGHHNVQNALAAIAVAWQLGISPDTIRQSLARFSGVKRRFTCTGVVHGITIIDDYGHHPVEIQAVLKAAHSLCQNTSPCSGRVVAVFQPHRYSRVRDLFQEFSHAFEDADHVIVAPIYGAGEAPLESLSHKDLAQEIETQGGRPVTLLEDVSLLASVVSSLTQEGDYVVCLGAGNITEWAQKLPSELESFFHSKAG